jgi:XTP/dITP diphosphohydrolase
MQKLQRGDTLVLASHNKGKLREIAELLAPLGLKVISAGDLGLPEPDETEPDFVGNARLKAEAAAQASGLPALSDDSGFCVAGLAGAPGVFSARWAGADKNFTLAMARVERELGDCADRRAAFVCALALAFPDGEVLVFEGRVEGSVVFPPRGTQGFGYDPIFVPAGGAQTYGEMLPAEKHRTSHRARAMALLLASGAMPARV